MDSLTQILTMTFSRVVRRSDLDKHGMRLIFQESCFMASTSKGLKPLLSKTEIEFNMNKQTWTNELGDFGFLLTLDSSIKCDSNWPWINSRIGWLQICITWEIQSGSFEFEFEFVLEFECKGYDGLCMNWIVKRSPSNSVSMGKDVVGLVVGRIGSGEVIPWFSGVLGGSWIRKEGSEEIKVWRKVDFPDPGWPILMSEGVKKLGKERELERSGNEI